jgi:Protein of unknown function (DUF1445)
MTTIPATLSTAEARAPPRSTIRTSGDPVERAPGDIPVFWACEVTIQAALMAARPPFAITHAPGHMFITDVPDSDYRERKTDHVDISSERDAPSPDSTRGP